MDTIGSDLLKTSLDAGTVVLIDVLPEFSFNAEHISGAKNAAVFEMAFLGKVKELVPDLNQAIVVYDTGDGSLAAKDAVTKLTAAGYTSVRALDGGLASWKASGESLAGDGIFPAATPDPFPTELSVNTGDSVIRWTGRNLANQHFGTLKIASGTLTFDEGGMLSGGEIIIDMGSIGVDDIKDESLAGVLIAHLVSDDFFEADKYPTAQLVLDTVEATAPISNGSPNLAIQATLTLKDVSAPIEIQAVGGLAADGTFAAQASFEFDRTTWNVLYGSGKLYQRLGMHLVNDFIALDVRLLAG